MGQDAPSEARGGPAIRCPDCDLLQRVPRLDESASAHCARCGRGFGRRVRDSLDWTLALAIAALILLVVANASPFMTFAYEGRSQSNFILTGVLELRDHGLWGLAALISFTSILAPFAYLVGMLFVIAPLRLGMRAGLAGPCFRILLRLRPWAMLEVYLFGVLVAVVKLDQLASIRMSTGFYAYAALFLVWTEIAARLDTAAVWDAIGTEPRTPAAGATRAAACEACSLISRVPEDDPRPRCPRCGARLDRRKPDPVARTWALILAAAILYVPANYYPILEMTILGKTEADTIFSGVRELFQAGMWEIGAIIFLASITVPLLKLIGIAFLLVSVQRRWSWAARDRTRVYRMIEVIGRWSMIDMFMLSILVALVQLGGVATIDPSVGATCFASVVVITMFAAATFDPRLIWDRMERS